jgi:hypothetical protein
MAAFLDVDLEQVTEVILRRAGQTEVALLLDGGWLGVALGDDDAPQIRTMLARDILPRRLALVLAKVDLAAFPRCGEENAPAEVGHFDVAEICPAG